MADSGSLSRQSQREVVLRGDRSALASHLRFLLGRLEGGSTTAGTNLMGSVLRVEVDETAGDGLIERARPAPAFTDFAIGELQLLQLGLWVLGEEDRVDERLMDYYRSLVARVRSTMAAKIADAR